jgi:hypothetical protein
MHTLLQVAEDSYRALDEYIMSMLLLACSVTGIIQGAVILSLGAGDDAKVVQYT